MQRTREKHDDCELFEFVIEESQVHGIKRYNRTHLNESKQDYQYNNNYNSNNDDDSDDNDDDDNEIQN